VLSNEERQAVMHALNDATHELEPPLQEMEHALHPWVVFLVMPLFALVNAGVPLNGGLVESLTSPVALGIVAGLVLGKQLGVTLLAWLAIRSGVSELPEGVTWHHVYGAGWLAGIGFTMSLFISGLAFASDSLLDTAKLAILVASLIAGVVGWTILRGAGAPRADG
jgi:NhaA family Na+:H+ antiporter